MTISNAKNAGDQPQATLTTGADAPMTPEQVDELRSLAQQALEIDAFSTQLTRPEAKRRIDMLKAKLKLLSEPPHSA